MTRIPGGVHYEPADLGWDGAAVGASSTVIGSTVPWCHGFRIRAFGLRVEVLTGNPNFFARFRWFGADGQTNPFAGDESFQNPASTVADYVFWGSDGFTPQAAGGNALQNTLNKVFTAPYGALVFQNQDLAGVTVRMECWLWE